MNKLSIEKRVQLIKLLVEGNSIRGCCRIADVSKNTVTKLLVDVGQACQQFHDDCADSSNTEGYSSYGGWLNKSLDGNRRYGKINRNLSQTFKLTHYPFFDDVIFSSGGSSDEKKGVISQKKPVGCKCFNSIL